MEPFDEIQSYTDTVCEQIRWEKITFLLSLIAMENSLFS